MARNVCDMTLGHTDVECSGLVGPANSTKMNRDVRISGHTAWLFCFLHKI